MDRCEGHWEAQGTRLGDGLEVGGERTMWLLNSLQIPSQRAEHTSPLAIRSTLLQRKDSDLTNWAPNHHLTHLVGLS